MQRFFASAASAKTAAELMEKGVVSWNKGNVAQAESFFRESAHACSTGAAYYNWGNAAYTLGKTQDAIQAYKKSLALEDKADVHVNLANCFAQSKQLQDATHHYQKALGLDDSDGEVWFNHGVVLEYRGLLHEALVAYQNAQERGIERAEQNIRNCQAKSLGEKSRAD